MSELYYIRVRGQVQGPFEAEKLRQLARRGQFSRMHEVSIDGQQWKPANERPELFAAAAVALSAPANQQELNAGAGSRTQEIQPDVKSRRTLDATHVFASEDWYYVHGGKEQGPIGSAALIEMFASRRLTPDTDVWRKGMADWVPAHTIPDLVADTSATPSARLVTDRTTEVGDGVIRVLVESRGWVIFIAIMAFVYAAFLLIGGLLIIILGPRLAADTAAGLIQMISSIVVAAGGWLLMSYATGLERFDRNRDQETLAIALTTLRRLWMYIGIVLIILLTFSLIAVVVVLSMAGSLSGYMGRFPGT